VPCAAGTGNGVRDARAPATSIDISLVFWYVLLSVRIVRPVSLEFISMSSRKRFSVTLTTCALALAACSGKAAVREDEPSSDGGPPIYIDEQRNTDQSYDDCEVVDQGQIVVFQLSNEFPIYDCPEDEDGGTPPSDTDGGTTPPPQEETDAGTPPGETDAGTPPGGDTDAGTPSGDTDSGTPPQDESDSGTPPQGDSDGGTPTGDTDGGTPPGDTDGGTPPQEETDAGTPPGETDAGTPPDGDTDAGTPSGDTDSGTPPGDTDGGCDHDDDGGQPDEEPLSCNRKITVVVHSGETTTYVDDVLHCTFTIEYDAVNTRVVRICDKETEVAETKAIGEVGESGQLMVRLTTPHRCGHYHEL